ncbi:hypothetical protein [Agarivorans sp. Alg241-V36]|uniref:hypothetical protein n=1 Tax=Agarivorans sp. Alg241-V36 TaxID=2305992 RepID=UPI0013CFC68C|nr:hypothetical protein [Agarivorans sp. Alg241-V36]
MKRYRSINPKLTLLSSALLLAACASTPVDETPKEQTAVVTAKVVLNGLYVPDSQGEQVVYTREDMRTIHNQLKPDSFYMKWAGTDSSGIFRMDKNLLWQLDHKNKTYQECALSGCVSGYAEMLANADESEEGSEEYESYEDLDCKVELTKNEFEVLSTGNKRQIGGQASEEYKVKWSTEFTDEKGKKDLNLLQFVFWTADPNAEMKEAWRVHEIATNKYLDSVGENNPLVRLLGREGFKTISAFTGDTEQADHLGLNAFQQELAKIKGYPLSIKLEWFQNMQACADNKKKEKRDTNIDFSGGLEDAATNLLGNIVKNAADDMVEKKVDAWMKDARIRYIYEVKTVENKLAHNSNFDVPNDYQLFDRN